MKKLGDWSGRIADVHSWIIGLVIALLGIGMAWWFLFGPFEWVHLVALAVLVTIPLAIAWSGRGQLPDRPAEAVSLFGWRTLAALVMAAVGAAVVVVITVKVVAPESATADVEELIGALSAALTAAVAASLVDVSDDIDGPASSLAESSFKAAYDGRFESDSRGRKAVYSELWQGREGWSYAVRKERAQVVADALLAPPEPKQAAT